MFTQRLGDLGEHINSHGCALISVAAGVGYLQPHRHITPNAVRKVYSEALRTGDMKPRSFIQDWTGVWRLFGVAVTYLGHMAADWEPGVDELEICEWVHPEFSFSHFTFGGDTRRHPFFDPWGSAGDGYLTSRSVAEGRIQSKRGFRILEA